MDWLIDKALAHRRAGVGWMGVSNDGITAMCLSQAASRDDRVRRDRAGAISVDRPTRVGDRLDAPAGPGVAHPGGAADRSASSDATSIRPRRSWNGSPDVVRRPAEFRIRRGSGTGPKPKPKPKPKPGVDCKRIMRGPPACYTSMCSSRNSRVRSVHSSAVRTEADARSRGGSRKRRARALPSPCSA